MAPIVAASLIGIVAGLLGAVVGTPSETVLRGQPAAALGRDLPAALIEDALAIGAAIVIVGIVR